MHVFSFWPCLIIYIGDHWLCIQIHTTAGMNATAHLFCGRSAEFTHCHRDNAIQTEAKWFYPYSSPLSNQVISVDDSSQSTSQVWEARIIIQFRDDEDLKIDDWSTAMDRFSLSFFEGAWLVSYANRRAASAEAWNSKHGENRIYVLGSLFFANDTNWKWLCFKCVKKPPVTGIVSDDNVRILPSTPNPKDMFLYFFRRWR